MEDKKFTWKVKDFLSLQSEIIYSEEFVISGCKWRLMAYPNGDRNGKYVSLFLDVPDSKSLPCGWRRRTKFSLTVVNHLSSKYSVVRERFKWFDQKTPASGFKDMITRLKLLSKMFRVDGEVEIVVEIDVLEVIGQIDVSELSKEESVSSNEESVEEPEAETDVSESSKEVYDSPKEVSEAESDSSEEESEDEPGVLESSKEVSKSSKEDECEVASRPRKKTKLNDERVVSSDFDKNTQQVKETMSVHGFQVLPSQVACVTRIFEKHPDIAVEFRAKNQHLRTSCMNTLLNLIETLCQSLQEVSLDDLLEAKSALTYVKDSGFKVDWLEKKLEEVKEKKVEEVLNEKVCEMVIQSYKEDLKEIKQKCADKEALLKKEKEELKELKLDYWFVEDCLRDREKAKALASVAIPLTLDDIL